MTSSPVGINCGADCSEPYNLNTTITLTTTPATGQAFKSWAGCTTRQRQSPHGGHDGNQDRHRDV